jgi:sigma-B regulation protein RsbU (phosphoserine phosphatase)
MPRLSNVPKPVLLLLAAVFSAATAFYAAVWMYYATWQPSVAPIGLQFAEPLRAGALEIIAVDPGGAADAAGLHPGDRITAINGTPVKNAHLFYDAVLRGRPGEEVRFETRRTGAPAANSFSIRLQAAPRGEETHSFGALLARELARLYPLLFLFTGVYVLFVRIEDWSAWLLALLFAAFIAGPGYDRIRIALQPEVRPFILSYGTAFAYLGPAFFYAFFATFPDASPVEKRAPWMKWAVLATCAMVALPTTFALWFQGLWFPFYVQYGWITPAQYAALARIVLLGFVLLGFAALFANAFEEKSAVARRKYRVILWGTVVGFGPEMLRVGAAAAGVQAAQGHTVQLVCLALLILVPLSLAHAVVKHRVMELPLLLKRSARYMIVRRGLDLLLLLLAFAWVDVATGASEGFVAALWEPGSPMAGRPVDLRWPTIFGMVFGALLVVGHRRLSRGVTQRLDRAFFRSVYDSRQVLEELAQSIPGAGNRGELAALIERQILEALHPESLAIYLAAEAGHLRLERFTPGPVPATMERLTTDAPVLHELARRGRPWELPPQETPLPNLPQLAMLRAHLEQAETRAHRDALGQLAPLAPECLVPILGRERGLTGLVVLGARLSEEPYSDEDEQLLATVARQAGVALENIRLAEEMAARLEAEHRRASEMAIAREVQSKLFPQRKPPLTTLDYAGSCDQARTIGGDYYDYLDLGKGRAGLVLADISGKGIFAALLMANLQANLRSQYVIALEDLGALMRSVNRLFYESVTPGLYATMFIADYSDDGYRLRFVNCGHNPPLLVRAAGPCQRLEATATVVGLVEEWECTVGEVRLVPGDTLVIYSDGVTEASSDAGEFFGEQRLEDTIRQHAHLPAADLAKTIAATVHAFSGKEQEDDLTLLVARAR